METKFRPEYCKTIFSFLYILVVLWITAISMVIVHERVPDKDQHPPLPDSFLKNVPYSPWAFQFCEIFILVMTATWTLILFFHKHRSIAIRRFFTISGSLYLLRCATMLMTSLPVPGSHLECAPRELSGLGTKLKQAWIIWQAGGLVMKGVHTCGDYMFSGHATALSVLSFFIREYTPRRMYWLHITSWVMNISGIIFILAAHEHYSIDVVLALVLTLCMCLYYHSYVNDRALHQRNSLLIKILFPPLSCFEANIDDIVPNEYSNPLCHLLNFWKSKDMNPFRRIFGSRNEKEKHK